MNLNGLSRFNLQPQQIEDLFREEDLPLQDLRKKRLGIALIISCGLFLLIAVLMATIKIPIEQNFDFTLRASKQEEIYRFPNTIYLIRAYVKPQQIIKASAPLFEITSPEIVKLIMELEKATKNLEVYTQHDLLIYKNLENELFMQINGLEQDMKAAWQDLQALGHISKNNIARLQSGFTETNRRYVIDKDLYVAKVISEYELKSSEQEKIRSESELKVAWKKYSRDSTSLANSLNAIRHKKEALTLKVKQNNLELVKKWQSLKDDHVLALKAIKFNYGEFEVKGNALLLKSPISGTVSFVLKEEKEVAMGKILMKVSRNSSFYASSSVRPDQVGYIKSGYKAILKVSTFPHFEWGVLKGIVKNLSMAADEKGNYPFEVSIGDRGKIGNLLQTGMTGKLSIAVEEKTIFQLLFRKLNDQKDRMLE